MSAESVSLKPRSPGGWALGLLAMLLVLQSYATQVAAQDEEVEILGKRSPIALESEPDETVQLVVGTRILERPQADAAALATVRFEREATVLGRDGDWLEVRYESWKGWIRDPKLGVEPRRSLLDRPRWIQEIGADGERRFALAPPVNPVSADTRPMRLKRLRTLLGEGHRTLDLGPYRLYTDVEDQELLTSLRLAVSDLERIYQERFGLELLPVETSERAAIVLFASEEGYRTYTAEVPELEGLETLGHQSSGLAVTFAGLRTTDQIRQILVHELTHLLNRRALPLALPSWLEEGIAEELSLCRVNSKGRLLVGSLSGVALRSLGRITITDGMGALTALLRHFSEPTWPRVTEIVDTEWEEFVQPGSRLIYYTQAAFFVRFLVDGRRFDGELGNGFRRFLDKLARGDGTAPDLWQELGRDKTEIESAYEAWIWARGQANGVVVGTPVPR